MSHPGMHCKSVQSTKVSIDLCYEISAMKLHTVQYSTSLEAYLGHRLDDEWFLSHYHKFIILCVIQYNT
jgi:hypothetical protein